MRSHPLFESLCDLRLNQCTSTPPQRTPRRGAYFVRVLRLPKSLGELDTDLIVFDGEVAVDLLAFKRVRQLGAHGAIGIIGGLRDARVGDARVLARGCLAGQQCALVRIHVRIGDGVGLVVVAGGDGGHIAVRNALRAEHGGRQHAIHDTEQHEEAGHGTNDDEDFLLLLIHGGGGRARCGYRCRSGSDGSRGLRGLGQNGGHRETGKNMGIPCPASYIDCPSCPKRRCRFGAASWANTHTHSCHGTSVAE
ncbi:hypothetical protein GBJ32_06325 [Bifidobacterium longum]|uniref:Uncharacterized protein n=1 Tax=Bifidobacterium longum TaxID=216816 RepID=A0A374SWP3_BIFLN|nr:hypothetical protein DVB78_01275 [Bifidobacterium longum subsp. longum]KAB6723915.1 hypothetical protein GBL36_00015 [Bifidobacterium longum]KAB6724112.1 hypothetical protein GBL29_01820 [Bifidobacterium longum]KAB6730467.1 hypothetical protein GBL24_00015 [Bifidobacterium longum]KAB6730671.1 hypothetical protein GBL17_00915 [Bifidobacterium longum]